jgi:hypothetical protein
LPSSSGKHKFATITYLFFLPINNLVTSAALSGFFWITASLFSLDVTTKLDLANTSVNRLN